MLDPDLSESLAAGVSPDDVPELAPLLAAREIVGSFISLFRGTDTEVLLRLLVLRVIGQQAETPRWAPEALRSRFTYLDPVKLETVLKRLREHALLQVGEEGMYLLTDLGRNAVAALATLLQFGTEEDAELGFLTAQLAGLQATGTLTAESLSHLLGKLNELSWHFEEAIASGSEFRILTARKRLANNGKWLDRGTEILRKLLADPEVDFELARVAQRIGLAQSRLARADAGFQRALNKIETQRVTLGASGISSSDVAAWLRTRDRAALAALADAALTSAAAPALLAGGHELLDRAEVLLSDRVRIAESDHTLPPAADAEASPQGDLDDMRLLDHFVSRLARFTTATPLAEAVAGGGFAPASYRLSLLALLADGGHACPDDGPMGTLMSLPLDVEFGDHLLPVGEDEIEAISGGRVVPRAAAARN